MTDLLSTFQNQLVRLRADDTASALCLGITSGASPQVALQAPCSPSNDGYDEQIWQIVKTPYPFMGFKAKKGTIELYLNGHTITGAIDLAPNTHYPYTGTAWEATGTAPTAANFSLACKGQILKADHVLLSRNSNSLELIANTPSTQTNWTIETVPFLPYPYADWSEKPTQQQLTGWPLSDKEALFITKHGSKCIPKNAQQLIPRIPCPQILSQGNDYKTDSSYSFNNPYLVWHRSLLEYVRQLPRENDILLAGDSITMQWNGGIWFPVPTLPFIPPWSNHFAQYTTVNLGYGGDTTESLLWRLDHGALDGGEPIMLQPRLIILAIGTNDVGKMAQYPNITSQNIADGIKLCAQNLHQRCPQAKILLVHILPRYDSQDPDGTKCAAVRSAVKSLNLNNTISNLSEIDLTQYFPNTEEKITEYYSDRLHLKAAGYKVYADNIAEKVNSLLSPTG